MYIRSIIALAAVVLASTAGAASAADRFSVLDGVAAEPLTAHEMAVVEGSFFTLNFVTSTNIVSMNGLTISTSTVGGFSTSGRS